MHVDFIFIGCLEHYASQEGPKTAKKPSKMDQSNLQEPLRKRVQFWIELTENSLRMEATMVHTVPKTC